MQDQDTRAVMLVGDGIRHESAGADLGGQGCGVLAELLRGVNRAGAAAVGELSIRPER